ncbi:MULTISPECIES: DUF885 family protein [unclassified Breznakia]|uniref:DUF885 family protein n=1 Tax=unclassified Breznakia TaxID=2623764 RepID=UPI0024749584|nr:MULTISPECIES: DUF885 family protein [unclassified Breznakia]MDH6367202.1 uncharacterized protein (DUF885 family) [Breznakia sp. PH1-1]MDH6404378.1 uncharacterized protein (DUF885 family) [Breznakia sp. PF1-11]MDH6412087.1 uncharacterized protein (DUF885 family) [Breznakia sp. PFB1-11]MDH6414366.1 uncharacterized protein (DUF885 family) [Breznakia sp. PFB1-14]MDH6416704.1 uncharacterized protein (DUF885 family) [Breznakia sp. PFB1-4]
MKKLLNVLLVFVMAFTLVACSSDEEVSTTGLSNDNENKEFTEYVDSLIDEVFDETDYSLNYFLSDKEKFGYSDDVLYEQSIPTFEDFKASQEHGDAVYEKIKGFKRDDLSEQQQLTYDVLLDAYEPVKDIPLEDLYYLTTNDLDYNHGAPGNIPFNFYFYTFRNEQDVKSYLNLLETTESYFGQLIAFEQVRQDKGFGMQPMHIAKTKEVVETYVSGDHSFLIDSFKTRIDEVDGISKKDKAAYIKKNEELVNGTLQTAYTNLATGLDNLQVKAVDEGMSQYANGKELFAKQIKDTTGMDIEEYRTYVNDMATHYLNEAQENYSNISFGSSVYTKLKDPNEVLEDLSKKTKDDFPAVRDLEYEMEIVPESMRKILGNTAAAYFVSPIDEVHTKERMILNGDFTGEDFSTIAHEGYPGHMYQKQYYKEQEQPLIRSLLDYSGYTEGWANYVQFFTTKYALKPEAAKANDLAERWQYCLILQADLEINYDGKTKEEMMDSLEIFGDIDEIYSTLAVSPGIFAEYYVGGQKFIDLYEKYDDVDAKKFHEAILKIGPAPFSVVEEYVEKALK